MKYIKAVLLICFFSSQALAAQTTWNNGDSGAVVRAAIQANDTELYNIKVEGPASSTVDNIPTFSDTTGKNLKDSGASIDATGIKTPAVASPSITMKDSDAPDATDQEIVQISGEYIDGATGAENADMFFYIKQAGSFVLGLMFDESDDQWEFSKNTTLQAGDIVNDEIADGTIEADKLEATNTPTDNQIASYDDASGGVTWVDGVVADPINTETVIGATLVIDIENKNYSDHTVTIDQNTAITFSNFGSSGTRFKAWIKTIQSGGDFTVTIGGVSVDLTASGNDTVIAYTDDGGTTVNAVIAQADIN